MIRALWRMNRLVFTVMLILTSFLSAGKLSAHEVRPALLQITEQEPGRFEVTWKAPVLDGKELGISPIMPSVMTPIGPPASHNLPGATIEYTSYQTGGRPMAGETIALDGLSATQIDVLLEIELADGTTHSAILKPAFPSFVIPATASSWEVAKSYWSLGVEHILSGVDHLMFVLALMLLIRNNWMLFKAITAFTVAHSITLGLSTLGIVHIPPAPTEAIIALSIVFLAAELIRSREGKFSLSEQHPWVVAFAFGLFHGLGFAGALTELGLPQHAIPMALVSFNVGVECGQLLFIGVLLAIMFALRRVKFEWPSGDWRLMPYIIGSMASFWFIQRLSVGSW